MRRILFANPFGIGDVLFSTPLVRLVKETYPEAYIGYVCNRRTAPILQHNRRIDRVFIMEKDEYRALWERSPWACLKALGRFFHEIRQQHFDVLFDLSLNDRFSLLAMWFIPTRVGFNYKGRGRFLTKRLTITAYQDKNVVEYYMDLARFVGLRPRVYPTEFQAPEPAHAWARERFHRAGLSNAAPIIGLIPGSGASWGGAAWMRRWLESYYAATGDLCAERLQARTVLFGGPGDEHICRRVAAAMRHRSVNLCGQGDLVQFAAMLRRCAVVIGHDGGPMHIAVSQEVPTVAVYGPVDERVYGPYPPNPQRHRVLVYDPGCRPCYQRFHMPLCPIGRQCLSHITPERVTQAVEELLRTYAHCPVLQ